MALGFQISLEFSVTQHIRDVNLMHKLIEFFGFGYLAKDGDTKYQFRVRKTQDLVKLIHLFEEYPLQTQKRLDAEAFRQVLMLVLAKQHLNPEGLEEIRLIKATMNRARMKDFK